MMIPFKVSIAWRSRELDNEHTLLISGSYSRPRPAPRTSDPDDPGFSDPGDPGDLEIDEILIDRGGLARKLPAKVRDNLADDQDLQERVWDIIKER